MPFKNYIENSQLETITLIQIQIQIKKWHLKIKTLFQIQTI